MLNTGCILALLSNQPCQIMSKHKRVVINMKSNFYETPIISGPSSNIVMGDGCKAWNTFKNVVAVGVVVVGVVVSVVTVPEAVVIAPILA